MTSVVRIIRLKMGPKLAGAMPERLALRYVTNGCVLLLIPTMLQRFGALCRVLGLNRDMLGEIRIEYKGILIYYSSVLE